MNIVDRNEVDAQKCLGDKNTQIGGHIIIWFEMIPSVHNKLLKFAMRSKTSMEQW